MTSHLSVAWSYAKEYAAAVISAGLIYLGLLQILSQMNSTTANGILWFINWIIKTGFRDRLLLWDVGFVPWQYQVMGIAAGFIPIVLGIFVGLWVNTRKQKYKVST